MFRFFIDNEEVVCESSFEIKEEFMNPSSIELYKVFPKKWKGTNKLLEEYYFPKDYSKCNIYDFDKLPAPIFGKSEQETTKGYQLFDESKLPSKTQNGTILINNEGGSFTIKGNDILSGNFNYSYAYSHEETIKLLKAGNITISDDGAVGGITVPYYLAQLRNSNGQIFEISSRTTNSYSNTITKEMLDDETSFLRIGFFGAKGTNITKKTVRPMLFQDGDGTFEKFTGGKPSPNLDYPQEIKTSKGVENLFDSNLFEEFSNTMKKINLTLKPNTTYTMSSNIQRANSATANLFFFKAGETAETGKNSVSQNEYRTLTTDSTGQVVIVYRNHSNLLTNVDFKKDFWYMINEGSVAKEYVSYGNWLQLNKHNEEKSYLINMKKKNYFNIREYVTKNSDYYTTDENDNVICIKTDSRSSGFEYYEELPIGTYTLSTTNNCNLRIYESDDSSFPTQTVSFQRNDKNRIIFTTTKPYVTFKTFNSSLPSTIGQIKLFEGTNDDDYYELASLDEIRDKLFVDEDGNVELIKYTDKIILDEERNYQLSPLPDDFECTRFRTRQKILNNSLENYVGLCDKFVTRLPNSPSTDSEYVLFSNGYVYFSIKKSRLEANTESAFKKWIGNNPVIVYYKLEKEKTINVDKIDAFKKLIFSGIVKNSADMELNPFKPHYCSVQILDPSILLSEGTTLDYVIADKTVREAITQVISSISDYGFVEGNITIPEEENAVIGAYSTLDKAPYDIFQYFSQISGTRWGTRMIDENTTAIDFYSPELIDNLGTIEVSKKYCVANKIEELNYDYSTADYRNKQIITSEQVFANISTSNIIISNGYDTTFILEQRIGKINSVEVNGISKTFATKDEKRIGITADFYYEVASNQLESNDVYSAGTELIVNYTAIVQGREITYNTSEIQRINNNLGRNGTISRYENRTDVTSSSELQSVGKTYIKYNSNAELSINIVAGSDFLQLGGKYKLDSPVSSINGYYLVRAKNTNVLQSGDFTQIKYEYELNSNFNTENELNFFDNQRAKANGNISQGEYISRNIDIEDTTNIIFSDLQICELIIDSNNTLESNLETPLMD